VAIETLDRYCDDQDWVSCGYRDEYARHVGKADGWFLWRSASPFYTQMNGWHGDEQREIVEHAFRCCWPRIVSTTLAGALRQFVRIDSTDGLRPQDTRPAAAFMRRGGSAELASLRSSRQASGTLTRPVLHPLPERASFVTVGLAALTLITLMARAGDPRGLWLAAALFLFLAGNATICAFGSTLHARYQSRIAWLVIWMLPILVAWFRARSGSRQIGHSAVAIVSVAIAFAGVGVGCTQEEPPAEPASVPNVLLIVVDTLRADHLSVYGYERPTTPELERYFASADRYVQAYSAATFTSGSVVSMLSGLYPGAHGIRDSYVQVPDEIVLLPDLFSEQGYQTAGIVSNTVLTEEALGLGARFDLFDDFVDERESSRKIYERRGTSGEALPVRE
jgi:hypothetical protein